ncbi:VWA domain-containing protein [Marinomonas sp. A79]|uniref:VWA domain-containing protein n=1 Tax=Marinomonas vulgaris TaxID=2823372 RepID=A0ABS5HC15_9GAMM|nr:VWA domain-containing protein [Marinomonas vulgaris]MBR7889196.1 VWA domain-containing protein [Marinomonas vulgaris]
MTLFDLIHFERPFWLLCLPITWVVSLYFIRHSDGQRPLKHLIDDHLMPHLVYKSSSPRVVRWLGLICVSLCWIGLAGISWTKAPTTMFESTQKTVLVVDQSLSMYATDITPNRQTQLKQTIRDILAQNKDGEMALVAFAGEGFVISPFSQDRETITHFLLALDPIIMPTYGSNLTSGIETALSLHKDKQQALHLIILTDEITDKDRVEIPKRLADYAITLDLVAIGTQAGAVIQLPDGQILKRNGKNIVASTPISELSAFTEKVGGRFYRGRLSPQDLSVITRNTLSNEQTQQARNKSIHWVEQGHWFALPLLIWLAFQFRRGAVFALLLSVGFLPLDSLQASPLEWFLTPDQKGQQAVDQGDWATADRYFEQPKWKAASSYALENYDSTIQTLTSLDQRSAAENYNLGNALALSGDLQGAIEAYETALEQDPDLDAARENLEYVKQQAQQQQQQEQEQEQEQNQESEQQDSQDNSNPDNKEQNSDSDTENKNTQNPPSDEKNDNKTPEKQDKNKTPEDNKQEDAKDTPLDQNTPLNQEEQQALDQWLRQIQDDPGLLLQRKLWYLHQERRNEQQFTQEDKQDPW